MAEDKDLFGPRRDGRGGSQGGSSKGGRSGAPRTPSACSSPVGRPPKYGGGSFLTQVNKAVAKAHAAKGTSRYSKSKPKTGRFNVRGRGCRCRAYAAASARKAGMHRRSGLTGSGNFEVRSLRVERVGGPSVGALPRHSVGADAGRVPVNGLRAQSQASRSSVHVR